MFKTPRMRPRFRTIVPCHPDKAMDKFKLRLRQEDCLYQGAVLSRHVTLKVKEEQRHYWSPVLNIDAESCEEGTLLRGHFGPHPNVWTMFLALYASVIFSAIFACMYGFAQLMTDETPWAFASIPIALVLVGLIYTIALLGQNLAQEQMHQLRDFFACSVCHHDIEEIMGEAVYCEEFESQQAQQVQQNKACASCHQACEMASYQKKGVAKIEA